MANKNKIVSRQYVLNNSPFYRLESKARLADALALPLEVLQSLASSPSNTCYRMWDDPKSGRFITEPHGNMGIVHKRIAKLLGRIRPPAFLHSATKGRSYKTNASQHLKGVRVFKIDIKSYYTSISFGAVYRFFKDRMSCSVDVATLLSRLCTVTAKGRTHLPTGSSLSPILSYWVHSDLFNSVNRLCETKGCRMSLYVDDLTVSGENADKSLLVSIKKKISGAGLRAHKIRYFGQSPATVTGVIVFKNRLALPHTRAKDIREHLRGLAIAGTDTEKTLSKLVGKLNEAQQFVASYGEIKRRVLAAHASLWTRITEERVRKSKAAIARKRKKVLRKDA